MELLQWLDRQDRALFLFLNGLHADWADPVWVFITEPKTWFPTYGLLLVYILRKQGWKTGALTVLYLAIAVVLADQSSTSFAKPFFERLRPCQAGALGEQVHRLVGCSQYGFYSGHAATSFALATGLYLVFGKRWKWAFAWAAVVAYSRVYVGVHYPGDLLAGGLAGAGLAWLCFQVYRPIKPPAPRSGS